MIEVASSDRANMNVDVCQRCHFVWFDTREVDTLIPRPLPPAQPELPQKARELLAIEKVKRLAEEARGSDFDSVRRTNFGNKSRRALACPSNSTWRRTIDDRG